MNTPHFSRAQALGVISTAVWMAVLGTRHPGVRLVCLNSTEKFQQAHASSLQQTNASGFRVTDSAGRTQIDLGSIFDSEWQQANPKPPKLTNLSATTKRFRKPDGTVDLAAIFTEEAKQNGLTL
jgi:hypothetical protein